MYICPSFRNSFVPDLSIHDIFRSAFSFDNQRGDKTSTRSFLDRDYVRQSSSDIGETAGRDNRAIIFCVSQNEK